MRVACGGCNGAGEVARDVPRCAIQQKLTNNNNRGSSPLPNNGGGGGAQSFPISSASVILAVKTLKQNSFRIFVLKRHSQKRLTLIFYYYCLSKYQYIRYFICKFTPEEKPKHNLKLKSNVKIPINTYILGNKIVPLMRKEREKILIMEI
jgi:hypothetical protein